MITDEIVSDFLSARLSGYSDFESVEANARAENIPAIVSESAAFLKVITAVKNPSQVLEIGTASGLSGLIILKSCNCRLTTVERDEGLAALAKSNFEKFGYGGRVTQIHTDADDVVPKLRMKFDFIFLDANKSRYRYYLPYLADALETGGVLLCDNVLFGGRTLDESKQKRKSITITRGLNAFLDELLGDTRFLTSIVPVGDGMSFSVKQ